MKTDIQHYCRDSESKINPAYTPKRYVLVITYTHLQIQFLLHRKHSFSFTSINWLTQFWEITAVYCEKYTVSTMYSLNVTAGVIVTIVHLRIRKQRHDTKNCLPE